MSAQENTDKPVPQVPEENTAEGTKPSPSTSSPATRRLSVLINKAKKSISQAADKVSSPTEAKSSEPATTTENAGTSDEPVAAAANPTTEATTTTSDGAEKRRSRLVENFENFFHRSKVSKKKM